MKNSKQASFGFGVLDFEGGAMASEKQRSAARRNIRKAARAAKRKKTLKHLPKKTRRALGQQATKVRKSRQ